MLRPPQVSVAKPSTPALQTPQIHQSRAPTLGRHQQLLKRAVSQCDTRHFGRATSLPSEVWCLSTFPFPCPCQSTHTRTMSCPQNPQLQFMSPHCPECRIARPFEQEDYRSRRKLSTNNSCDPALCTGLWGKCETWQDGRCCSAGELFILVEPLHKHSLLQNAWRFLSEGEVWSMKAWAKSVILKITE